MHRHRTSSRSMHWGLQWSARSSGDIHVNREVPVKKWINMPGAGCTKAASLPGQDLILVWRIGLKVQLRDTHVGKSAARCRETVLCGTDSLNYGRGNTTLITLTN